MRKFGAVFLLSALLLTGCGAAATDNQQAEFFTAGTLAEDVADSAYESTADVPSAASFSETEETGSPSQDWMRTADPAGEITQVFPEDAAIQSLPKDQEPAENSVFTILQHRKISTAAADGTQIFVGQEASVSVATGSAETDAWIQQQLSEKSDSGALAFRRQLEQAAAEQYAAAAESETESSFYPYSYYTTASTARQDRKVLSLLTSSSTYSGEAHPTAWQNSINFDLQTRQVLELEDIIDPSQKEALLNRIFWTMENRMNALVFSGLYSNCKEVITESILGENITKNWYFTDLSLVLFFNHYEIAPYAAGVIQIDLPYQELGQILRPEYLPEICPETPGVLVQEDPAQVQHIIRLFPEQGTDGPVWTQLLGVSGVVRNVRVYRVNSWLNSETPLLGNMIFSASVLTEQNTIALSSDTPDAQAYLVYYQSQGGTISAATVDQFGVEPIPIPAQSE